nr:hypothetical protein [Tanacetum cinerariifolium]
MPLLEEKRSHCQKDRTTINVKKKLPVKDGSYAKLVPHVPPYTTTITTTNGETGTKSGKTVTLTAEDMQKKKNDVKARTTLLLSLPDEHQLRFSKYKTARELWTVILKTFGGNEATKKTKKNLLKQAPRSQDSGRRDNFRQGSKAEEQALKALMAIDENLETLKQEKEWVDGKLAGLLTASKDLDNLIESIRSDKNKEGLGYTAVPPPLVQLYISPKKDLSWTGLSECADDTVTDNSRPSPTVEITSEENQNRNPSVSENVASPITPKPLIKFVKPKDSQSEMRTPYRALWVPFVKRNYPPVNRKFSTGSRNFPTANRKFSTVSRKFPTGCTKSPTADMGMKGKAVKPSACWSWKPSQNLSNKGPKKNSVSVMFKKYTYIDTQGRLNGFSFLLAVASFFSGSGKFFWQWKLCNWQWECLVHFIPNIDVISTYMVRRKTDESIYDEHGSEIGGYNDLMKQQRRSRILVTLGNDPGADTFYVTRYDEHGSEIGGYNDLMKQQRRSRILVTLGNDPGESPISASTNLGMLHY